MPSLSLIIKCSLYEHSQIHSCFFCKSESGELSKLFVNTCYVSDAYFAKGSEVEHTNILCHIERLLSTRQRQTFMMYKQDTDYEMEFRPNHKSRVLTDHGDEGGDDDPRGASRRLSAGAKAKAKATAGSAVGSGGASSSRGPATAIPLPTVATPVGEDDAEFEVFGGGGSSGSAGPGAVPAAPAVRRGAKGPKKKHVAAIGASGGEVRYEDAIKRDGTVYSNWHMTCPHCPTHLACGRTMGLGSRNTLGPLGTLAFLHVWRDLAPGPKGHRLTNPPKSEVTKYFEAHKSELEDIWDQFDHL